MTLLSLLLFFSLVSSNPPKAMDSCSRQTHHDSRKCPVFFSARLLTLCFFARNYKGNIMLTTVQLQPRLATNYLELQRVGSLSQRQKRVHGTPCAATSPVKLFHSRLFPKLISVGVKPLVLGLHETVQSHRSKTTPLRVEGGRNMHTSERSDRSLLIYR